MIHIYKGAFIKRPKGEMNIGKVENYDSLHGVSLILWEADIEHECKLNADDGHVDELEVTYDNDTGPKLLELDIISQDEYFLLEEEEVDYITIV